MYIYTICLILILVFYLHFFLILFYFKFRFTIKHFGSTTVLLKLYYIIKFDKTRPVRLSYENMTKAGHEEKHQQICVKQVLIVLRVCVSRDGFGLRKRF